MGEIFERPAPPEALAWTGERLTTAVAGAIEIEHLHRYFFARELCRGRDVLDVASGEGYGAALLAAVARTVTGVEIDAASVAHAARSYRRQNLAFVEGDARAIPLDAASIDVVVSFETLEHFLEQEAFLSEVKRVLRPGGLLVLSTPDRDVYSPAGSPANPYHAKELTRLEFAGLLAGTFAKVAIYAQRTIIGSLLLPEGHAGKVESFERRGPGRYEASLGVPRAPYLVIVASDAALPEPVGSAFFETDRVGEVLEAANERRHLTSALERARGEAATRLAEMGARLQAAEDAAHAARAAAEAGALERGRLLEALERERTEAATRLADMGARLQATEGAAGAAAEAATLERGRLLEALERERAEAATRLADLEARLQAVDGRSSTGVGQLTAATDTLRAKLASLEAERDTLRASLRAQAALLGRLRHGAPAPPPVLPPRPGDGIAWRAMRATARRVLPRSTRSWLRRKLNGAP